MSSHQFDEFDYLEIDFYSKMISHEKREDIKNSMISAAFTAWLSNQTNKSFNDYLLSLGLGEKPVKLTDEQKTEMIKRSYDIAEKIKAADRKNNEKAI